MEIMTNIIVEFSLYGPSLVDKGAIVFVLAML